MCLAVAEDHSASAGLGEAVRRRERVETGQGDLGALPCSAPRVSPPRAAPAPAQSRAVRVLCRLGTCAPCPRGSVWSSESRQSRCRGLQPALLGQFRPCLHNSRGAEFQCWRGGWVSLCADVAVARLEMLGTAASPGWAWSAASCLPGTHRGCAGCLAKTDEPTRERTDNDSFEGPRAARRGAGPRGWGDPWAGAQRLPGAPA